MTSSLDFESEEIKSLSELVAAGHARVFLTDITDREIRKKISDEMKEAYKRLSVSDLRYLKKIPLFRKFLSTYSEEKAVRYFEKGFDEFLQKCSVEIVSSKSINIIDIFDDYAKAIAPFGNRSKKAEFPDAFALHAILQWVQKGNEKTYLLSGDGDWQQFVDAVNGKHTENKIIIQTLTSLSAFTNLIYQNEDNLKDLATFSEMLVKKRMDEINAYILRRIEKEGFVEDTTEEVELMDLFPITVTMSDREIITVNRASAVYKVTFEIGAVAKFEETDYANSPWDPEEHRYFMIQTNTVFTNTIFDIEVQLEFTFSDGLEANFEILDAEIPDLMLVPFDEEEIIDIHEWALTLPVIVCGVENGIITSDGSGVEEYENIFEARKRYPTLDIDRSSPEFTAAFGNKISDKLRFETREAFNLYSS